MFIFAYDFNTKIVFFSISYQVNISLTQIVELRKTVVQLSILFFGLLLFRTQFIKKNNVWLLRTVHTYFQEYSIVCCIGWEVRQERSFQLIFFFPVHATNCPRRIFFAMNSPATNCPVTYHACNACKRERYNLVVSMWLTGREWSTRDHSVEKI